jgi:DNA-binding transcriptional ArsR family regulator
MEFDTAQPRMIARVVERFGALAEENRIRLLLRLKQGEASVNTLAADAGLAQATVSKHLAVLRRVGIVDVRRQGVQAIYFIKDQTIFELCRLVCDGVVRQARQEHEALLGGVPEAREISI